MSTPAVPPPKPKPFSEITKTLPKAISSNNLPADSKDAERAKEHLRQVQTIRDNSKPVGSGTPQVVNRPRRRSVGSEQDAPLVVPSKPELGKAELEEYINRIAQKARQLAKLCQINSAEEAGKYGTKLVLFDFKEVSTIILEVMEKLSSHVEVIEIYEAAVTLSHTEKIVIAELESLFISGKEPEFRELLKNNLLSLLSAVKKASSDYVQALTREPLPLVVSIPGFRSETGRYINPTVRINKNRISYSFSASASVSRPEDETEVKMSYADFKLEHVDYDANFYRKFFYQQEHRNYIGIDEKFGPIAISVKKETVPKKDGSQNDSEEIRYRAIFRTKEGCDLRTVFPESSVMTSSRMRSRPTWADVIATINPSVQESKLKKMTDPKFQDELLKFDEHQLIKKLKFGLLYMKGFQKKEEDMFGNEHGSPEFEDFINFMGDRILLKGHKGHPGGLDVKNDTTGTHSVFTVWRELQIMFHVSTLLPYSTSPDDKQQIQRKRHIGNDIVTLIFMEGQGQWSPTFIKSQFLHIFVVVQRVPSTTHGVRRYRVAVISNEDVPDFGPDVPKPAEFDEGDELKHFLLSKMVNGENAAYKAPKFKEPHVRARQGLLEHLVETFVNQAALKSAQGKPSGLSSIREKIPKERIESRVPERIESRVPERIEGKALPLPSPLLSPTSPTASPLVSPRGDDDEEGGGGEFKAKELYLSEQRQALLEDIRRGSIRGRPDLPSS